MLPPPPPPPTTPSHKLKTGAATADRFTHPTEVTQGLRVMVLDGLGSQMLGTVASPQPQDGGRVKVLVGDPGPKLVWRHYTEIGPATPPTSPGVSPDRTRPPAAEMREGDADQQRVAGAPVSGGTARKLCAITTGATAALTSLWECTAGRVAQEPLISDTSELPPSPITPTSGEPPAVEKWLSAGLGAVAMVRRHESQRKPQAKPEAVVAIWEEEAESERAERERHAAAVVCPGERAFPVTPPCNRMHTGHG